MIEISSPQFGIHFVPTMSVAALLDACAVIARRGVSEVSLSDEAFALEPLTMLAAVAARHPTLQIGVRVTNPYIRHPLTLAREVQVLAALSDAGVTLGLALGGAMSLNATGMMQRRRIRSLIEAFTAVRTLLIGEAVRLESEAFQIDGRLEGKPPPPGRVRFELTGRGPRMLAAAAEHADAVLVVGQSFTEGRRTIAAVRTAAQVAGRPAPPAITWATYAVTDEALLDDIAPYMAYGLAEATTAERGVNEEILAAIAGALRSDGRIAAGRLVPRSYIAERVALGRPAACRERLNRFALEQGIDRVLLRIPASSAPDAWLDSACTVAAPAVLTG